VDALGGELQAPRPATSNVEHGVVCLLRTSSSLSRKDSGRPLPSSFPGRIRRFTTQLGVPDVDSKRPLEPAPAPLGRTGLPSSRRTSPFASSSPFFTEALAALGSTAETASSGSGCPSCGPAGAPLSSSSSRTPWSDVIGKASSSTGAGRAAAGAMADPLLTDEVSGRDTGLCSDSSTRHGHAPPVRAVPLDRFPRLPPEEFFDRTR
jgi:hypothetical protein